MIKDFLLSTIHEAGNLAVKLQASSLHVENKSKKDLVTNADIAVEGYVIESILGFQPSACILAEESSSDVTRDEIEKTAALWVIDPIDGTTNFAFGHPQFAVSIAYAEYGTVKCGAVYAPRLNELFFAELGEGAYLNGTRLPKVAQFDETKHQALVAVGRACCPEEEAEHTRRVEIVYKNALDLRRAGAGSLDICGVAAGRLHAFFETLHPWDVAAGVLIARETGCEKTRFAPLEGYHQGWMDVPDDIDGRNFLIGAPGAVTLVNKWLSDNE
jgi:myo-inositol-1(or 4)-monophosphatase